MGTDDFDNMRGPSVNIDGHVATEKRKAQDQVAGRISRIFSNAKKTTLQLNVISEDVLKVINLLDGHGDGDMRARYKEHAKDIPQCEKPRPQEVNRVIRDAKELSRLSRAEEMPVSLIKECLKDVEERYTRCESLNESLRATVDEETTAAIDVMRTVLHELLTFIAQIMQRLSEMAEMPVEDHLEASEKLSECIEHAGIACMHKTEDLRKCAKTLKGTMCTAAALIDASVAMGLSAQTQTGNGGDNTPEHRFYESVCRRLKARGCASAAKSMDMDE